ncbi:hypothetical protein OnM2_051063 [Erysiphe neolycopersici]|uniref:Uncharacterized protein n=1 Tax=Erysiphe neolycopersici TaxID=212602 RepID=A0A420HSK8_9PEZI|nr:hypothetical protein OnM2_051063 [Erysiphe neolycopersici]
MIFYDRNGVGAVRGAVRWVGGFLGEQVDLIYQTTARGVSHHKQRGNEKLIQRGSRAEEI